MVVYLTSKTHTVVYKLPPQVGMIWKMSSD